VALARWIAFVGFMLFWTSNAAATVLQFDGIAEAGIELATFVGSPYEESGYRIACEGFNGCAQWKVSAGFGGGETALFSAGTGTQITLTSVSGLPFDFNSISLSEFNPLTVVASITFVANTGYSETKVTNNAIDYETFTFGSGFQGVTSVTWHQQNSAGTMSAHQFDNVDVTASAVPEPGTLSGLGLAGLCWIRRRRRSGTA